MLSIIEDAVVACRRVWHYRGSVEWALLLTVEYHSRSLHITLDATSTCESVLCVCCSVGAGRKAR